MQNNLAEQIDARFENDRNASERGTRSSQKNLQNHITKKFNGIDNHFTLLTMMLLKAILRQPEGGGGVLPLILDRGVPRRFVNPNPI